jgi:hypothetical protein
MHHFGEAKDHEVEVLHSEASRGSNLRGDEIRPMAKAFDVVLTDDPQYGILKMTNNIEEQHFRSVHGEMVQVGLDRDGIGSSC